MAGIKAGISSPYSGQVTNVWSYTPTSPICFHDALRDHFILNFRCMVTNTVVTGPVEGVRFYATE